MLSDGYADLIWLSCINKVPPADKEIFHRTYFAKPFIASVARGAPSFFTRRMFRGGSDHLRDRSSLFCDAITTSTGKR